MADWFRALWLVNSRSVSCVRTSHSANKRYVLYRYCYYCCYRYYMAVAKKREGNVPVERAVEALKLFWLGTSPCFVTIFSLYFLLFTLSKFQKMIRIRFIHISCLKLIQTGFQNNCFMMLNWTVHHSTSYNEHSKTSFEKNCFSAWASTLIWSSLGQRQKFWPKLQPYFLKRKGIVDLFFYKIFRFHKQYQHLLVFFKML